ncbi:hypothetical protein NXH76_07045 [Blautia schinkii]|nr:hypothetical protein [Blautia schinkii]
MIIHMFMTVIFRSGTAAAKRANTVADIGMAGTLANRMAEMVMAEMVMAEMVMAEMRMAEMRMEEMCITVRDTARVGQ